MSDKHKTLDKLYIELKRRESMSDFSIPTETVRVYLDEFYAELYASNENRKKDEPKQSDVETANNARAQGAKWLQSELRKRVNAVDHKEAMLYAFDNFSSGLSRNEVEQRINDYLTSKTK